MFSSRYPKINKVAPPNTILKNIWILPNFSSGTKQQEITINRTITKLKIVTKEELFIESNEKIESTIKAEDTVLIISQPKKLIHEIKFKIMLPLLP